MTNFNPNLNNSIFPDVNHPLFQGGFSSEIPSQKDEIEDKIPAILFRLHGEDETFTPPNPLVNRASVNRTLTFYESEDQIPLHENADINLEVTSNESKPGLVLKRKCELIEASAPKRRHIVTTDCPASEGRIIPISWREKSVYINCSVFTINGENLQLTEFAQGKYHKVFTIETESVIQVGNNSLQTSQIVLKILNPLKVNTRRAVINFIEKEMRAYQELCDKGVPVARIFVDPMAFVDTCNPKNGQFWLVEKMEEKITGDEWQGDILFASLNQKSQDILSFAKMWLTKMATEEKDIINDFRKRNTMRDSTGNPRVIDFSPSETDKEDIDDNLFYYVRDWANGNPDVTNMLIADFPPAKKEWVLAKLEEL